LLFTFLTRPDI